MQSFFNELIQNILKLFPDLKKEYPDIENMNLLEITDTLKKYNKEKNDYYNKKQELLKLYEDEQLKKIDILEKNQIQKINNSKNEEERIKLDKEYTENLDRLDEEFSKLIENL